MLVLRSFDLVRVTRKVSESARLKTLTPKQVLQRLPIALTQVNAGNNSDNF